MKTSALVACPTNDAAPLEEVGLDGAVEVVEPVETVEAELPPHPAMASTMAVRHAETRAVAMGQGYRGFGAISAACAPTI